MHSRHSGEPDDIRDELHQPPSTLSESDAVVAQDDERGPGLPHIPLIDSSPPSTADFTPSWRGWIHAGTFPVAVVLGTVLIVLAHGAPAKWASAVFMLTSMLLFGVSALYHRFSGSTRIKVLLKRFDHANILLLIAGTYTPIAVLALPPDKGFLLLSVVWGGALLGIGFRMFWITAPRWLYVPIYLLLGWAAIMYIVDLVTANVAMMVLVIVGGALYTLGAIIYATRKPNPWPGTFGFHEIFHTCTVLAFGCHWTAALLIALDPAYNTG